ncbi:MAG: ABC transporter substrate-binding protein [Actinomycetota bacterium]|nr:ABC transporter substrate-binding protein [Actinomycetota bacterium]
MNRLKLRRLFALAAALTIGVPLAACGEKEEPTAASDAPPQQEKLTLMLDYFPNADHAGIYAAQATGEYAKAGLDVEIEAPPDRSAPLKLLQAGRADLAISYEPDLLLARDKETPLVSVGALVQVPLTSLMALGDGTVKDVDDLEGKTVATGGIPYHSAYLKTIVKDVGIDPDSVKEVNVGFNLTQAMLSGRADASLGSFWNYEGTDLKLRGRDPVILRIDQLGVPTYNELIFVSARKALDQEGSNKIRRFLLATARGHQKLRENPEVGVNALLKADPGLEKELQSAVVKTTTPLFFPDDEEHSFGWQDPKEWDVYGNWMYENDLLEERPDGSAAMTNEFLPGEGLDPGTAGFE